MDNAQIDHMVNRFLSWNLPPDFYPDAGISFKAEYNEGTPWPGKHKPIGTNLFTADQARQMIMYMLEGMPVVGEPAPAKPQHQPEFEYRWRVPNFSELTPGAKLCSISAAAGYVTQTPPESELVAYDPSIPNLVVVKRDGTLQVKESALFLLSPFTVVGGAPVYVGDYLWAEPLQTVIHVLGWWNDGSQSVVRGARATWDADNSWMVAHAGQIETVHINDCRLVNAHIGRSQVPPFPDDIYTVMYFYEDVAQHGVGTPSGEWNSLMDTCSSEQEAVDYAKRSFSPITNRRITNVHVVKCTSVGEVL